ncbi:gluconate 2-dehydrogenase subunit 3 family protein [Consotaella salsifontis]|uniref:Gluconate 2-dehydrogenase gamma chain n=1 Tax=Consotaella salsifontis TaxID=1365950 RepID=A0A1T4NI47_9HYPH|nr:gluconate 2-dehydrogenase subunit 3 family protein [Consotaella salsifontis]SJZ78793.1 gluconate 2-dehydrogenase gamma chain [Consotaella salsifontis]
MSHDPWMPTRRFVLQGTAAGALTWAFYDPAHAQDGEPVSLQDYDRKFFTAEEWAFILAATARLIPSDGNGPGAIEARVPVFIDLQMAGPFGQAADWYMEGPYQPDAPAELGFQSPLPPAQIYRKGIEAFNGWCQQRYGGGFADLEAAQQDEALRTLEGGKTQPGQAPKGEVAESSGSATSEVAVASGGGGELNLAPELRNFFSLLLQNTKEGYFADPQYGGNYQMQGWLHIGFPGARAAYREWADKWDVPYKLGPVSISGERA